MPNRGDDDLRLQRLADLSIEIRMLKARVQATLEEHAQSQLAPLHAARCPHCGHSAGLALLPREYRRLSTPVRCFACRRDSAAFDWVVVSGEVIPPKVRQWSRYQG
jgi:hypothetical protein